MRPTSPRSSIRRTRRLIPEMLGHSRKLISRVSSSPMESRSHIPSLGRFPNSYAMDRTQSLIMTGPNARSSGRKSQLANVSSTHATTRVHGSPGTSFRSFFSHLHPHNPPPFRLAPSTNTLYRSVPAGIYCSASLWAPLQELDLNPYDVRKKCGKEDGPLCYKQMEWIDEWMNLSAVQAELGVQKGRAFRSKYFVASPTVAI